MLINAALMGLGSVGRNLLTILAGKADLLRRDHGIGFRIVLVADSRGRRGRPCRLRSGTR